MKFEQEKQIIESAWENRELLSESATKEAIRQVVEAVDKGILHWIPYDGFENLTMPASAKHMILHYLKTGRFDDNLYGGVTDCTGTHFVQLKEFDD